MANGTSTDISGDGSVINFNYNLLTADHTGSGASAVEYADRSVQVAGTFDGATVIIEGSNDGGTTWAQLRDPAGTLISFTAAGLKSIMELTGQIRPRLSVVGTAADLEINLLARRVNTMRQ